MTNRWRTPLRLSDWDYRQPAIYHITICIADRTNRLATPSGSGVHLTDAATMVEHHLLGLPDRFGSVGIDSYVIMPNHVHFIIEMNLDQMDSAGIDLSEPIRAFKSITTKEYGLGVRQRGWIPY